MTTLRVYSSRPWLICYESQLTERLPLFEFIYLLQDLHRHRVCLRFELRFQSTQVFLKEDDVLFYHKNLLMLLN